MKKFLFVLLYSSCMYSFFSIPWSYCPMEVPPIPQSPKVTYEIMDIDEYEEQEIVQETMSSKDKSSSCFARREEVSQDLFIHIPQIFVEFDVVVDGIKTIYSNPTVYLDGFFLVCKYCDNFPVRIEVINNKHTGYCKDHLPKDK